MSNKNTTACFQSTTTLETPFRHERTFRGSARHSCRAMAAGTLAAGLLLAVGAPPAAAITITRTSGAVMQTDIPKALSCAYVSYKIFNNTASAYSNIWVKADSFTGGIVSLGGGDNGLYQIDDLAPGASKMAFFYVRATAATTLPQTHAINVYEGYPGQGGALVGNATFSLTVAATLENNSSKVTSVTYMPNPPTVGGTVLVTVVGDAGNVRNRDVINFTPAAYANWNAAAFELTGVTLSLTNRNIQARTISDYLELPADYSTWAAGGITYTAYYTFRAMTKTDANTPVSPITYATQGNASSHTTTTGYGSFAPILSPTNTTVLAKLVNKAQVYTNEIATYTVRFTNSGPNDVNIDRGADTLPAGMSYVPGSSRFNGGAVLDPQVSGTLLTWSETEIIPAGSSRDLVFQARASIAGYSTNRVVAYVGGDATLIDTTLRTDDNVPGQATVRTLLAPTAADDSFSVVEDGVLSVPTPGVLSNDSDLNGFAIHVVSHTQPANGTAALNPNGSFTYTPAANYYGSDSFSYTITNDNGRTATATVRLTVLEVNDAPSFTAGADQTVLMNAGAQTATSWATAISKGPANEAGQSLTFAVTNNNAALFSAQPAVSADGTLTYTPAPGLSGIATVTIYLKDNGGTANGGVDRSAEKTFTIRVIAYSIGNWVFRDANNNGIRDFGESGISGVQVALFANNAGQPSGSALKTTATDAKGDYRFDNLPAGTYIVVVDVASSPSLSGYASSVGWSTDMTLGGDLRDHGRDTPVSAGTVVNGIASLPVAVGEGLQPLAEIVSNEPGSGTYGPLGDAYDNLVVDFGFTPVYSIGNRVFFDDDYDLRQDDGEAGVPGVPLYAFGAGVDGRPSGEPLAAAVTDANGWYRLDGLVKGTYVVVLDREAAVAANGDLKPYSSTIGTTNDMSLAGDRWDHGWYHPLTTLGPVTNGYSSSPVTLGPALQPLGEQTNGVSGAGAHSPHGDDRDNLVVDFGLVRTFCIGNRVFLDDGSGGGTPDNGIQDGAEPGISNVAMRVFAADENGNPTGDALVIGSDNLTAALTNPDGWYRFFRLAPGDYVVVADVGLSTNLTGFAFRNGSTWVDPTAASTSLVGLASSTGYNSDLTLGGDGRDHGKDARVSLGVVKYGIAGPKITLGIGLQPLNEATNALTGAGSHAPSGDAYDNLVMDFGFAPTYSIGNRVFRDDGAGAGTANDGVQSGDEPGIAGARVELRTNGVAVATTFTDGSGYYRFDNLLAGNYTVFLPSANFSGAGVLAGMFSANGTVAGDKGDKGIDDANPAANGIVSGTVTVGLGVQPSGESDIGTGAGGNSAFGDAYDNLTVDFGLIEANAYNCSVGSLVWHDADNNGVYDAGESGIAGVAVEVWAVDANGDLTGGAAVGVTNTAADGTYVVDDLEPGVYRVRIPAAMFESGQPLALTNAASTLRSAADDQKDDDSNGAQIAAGQAVLSPVFQLSRGGEPVNGAGAPNEFGPGYNRDNSPLTDENGDMTVDFGFYAPTLDQAGLVSLGSLVWSDLDDDGVRDSAEPGISNVVLNLSMTNATGLVYWGTTQSAADGTYFFHDLMDGTNWVVRIPASNFAPGGALFGTPFSGGTPVNADNQTDDDNNALQSGGLGSEAWSPVIALTAGAAPTSESGPGHDQDAGNYIDANGDMTVDFGFTPVYSIGNQVFADLDNDGVMDTGENSIGGVPMLLFAADGSGDPAGPALDSAITDSEGGYRFDGLPAGAYVVVADVANVPALAHWVSSSGVSSDLALGGDGNDHGRDAPVSIGGVVGGIASVAVTVGPGAQPEGETAGEGAGAHSPYGDGRDNLTVDFGFTPTYSIGNKVYRDPDNDGQPDMDNLDEGGIADVLMRVFAADAAGAPTGAVRGASVTDSEGFYRVDGLVAGTYVVVADVANSPALNGYRSVTGVSYDNAGSGDLYDHGQDIPLGAGSVLPGGVASGPVAVGQGLQPMDGATGPGLGANGPLGDAYDNLVIDFGFYPLYSLGNRVFHDANNNGVLDGEEAGVDGVAMKLFAADSSGSPTGGVVGATSTDDGGYYRFDDLLEGTYVVVVDWANSANLAGYVSSVGASADTTLAGDSLDHGLDTPVSVGPVVNGIASVPVEVGQNGLVVPLGEATGPGYGVNGPNGDISDNLVVDFGFTETASVSGRAIEDINGNGLIEAGDNVGIADVTINLLSANGALLRTVTTDGSGDYSFTGLPPGEYRIEVVALPGWVCTGDADGGSDLRVAVTLASGQSATGKNFLGTRPGAIEGFVWNDLNADGVFDAAEMLIGLGGVTVSLETNGVAVATTTTMAGGRYLFENVMPGGYAVVQTDLAGWFSTADTDGGNDNRVAVSLTSGGQSTGNDFLDYTPAVISGSVRVDVNGDGQADAGDASGISGVTVSLKTNDVTVAATVTASDGSFAFTGLLPGSYTLVETDPAGYFSTSDNQLGVAVTSGQESGGHVFLDAQPGRVGDFVWEDVDGDGLQDAGEPGLSNVVVRLTDPEGKEISTNLTGTAGSYAFTNLAAGVYFVQILNPAGYTGTVARVGTDADVDSDGDAAGWSWPVLVASGEVRDDVDFGFYRPARLYGYAYQDADKSLTRSEGDGSASGMVVQVWLDGVQVATTNAAANGFYEFTGLTPGTYEVRFVCSTNALTAVPTDGPDAANPARNRAVATGLDMASVTYLLYSGHGVGENTGEPVNAGFTGGGPMSSGIDLRAFQGAEGVVVEFVAYDVEEDGYVTLYLVGPGDTVLWHGTCEVVAGRQQVCRFLVPGLMVEGAYDFVVQDEVNQFWEAYNVQVTPFSAEMVRMSLAGVTLAFPSLPEREYEIQWVRRLGDVWQTVTNVLAEGERTTVVVPHPDRASPSGFFRIRLK